MRPARFVLALLFGAAVLITFLKMLFFVAALAAVVGAVFFTFRAMRYAFMGWEMSREGRDFGPTQWQQRFQNPTSAMPLDSRSTMPTISAFEKRPAGRLIEVF